MELFDIIVTLLVLLGLFIILYMQIGRKHSITEVVDDLKKAWEKLSEKKEEVKEHTGDLRFGEIRKWRK